MCHLKGSVNALAVDPKHFAIDQRKVLADMDELLWTLLAAVKLLGLEELIVFCTEGDTAFVADIEKGVKRAWNKEKRKPLKGKEDLLAGVKWKLPKVIPMVHVLDLSIPRTQTWEENRLKVMKDMLSKFESL